MITSLLALLLRFALLAVFTFAFVVLFEHGPSNYLSSAQTEWKHLVEAVNSATQSAPAARGT